jgi:hypothetical protein
MPHHCFFRTRLCALAVSGRCWVYLIKESLYSIGEQRLWCYKVMVMVLESSDHNVQE